MKDLEFHEAANIFPLDEKYLDELANDIKKQGQQVAIELLDGRILDGRRRYLACKKAGVPPRVIEVDIADPVDYVVSINIQRRHLTPSQRAMCAAKASKLKEKYSQEAKERMSEGGKVGRKIQLGGKENLPDLHNTGQTRDKIGHDFGVSGRSVDGAIKVLRKGTPALQSAVDTGVMAISTAEKVSFLPPEKQDELVEQAKQGKRSGVRSGLDKNQKDTNSTSGLKGVGVIHAHNAIDCLKKIPKNDALRERGFQIVKDWIRTESKR